MPKKRQAEQQEREEPQNLIDEHSVSDKESSSNEEEEEEEIAVSQNSKLAGKLAKLKELRKRKIELEEANRKDVIAEHAAKKANLRQEARHQRKRNEAQEMLEKKIYEEQGLDYERKRAMQWSIEGVEKWEELQDRKSKRANIGFTDFAQLAHKKYERLTNAFKPDLETYAEKKLLGKIAKQETEGEGLYRNANSLDFVDGVGVKPSHENVERMVQDLEKQIETRNKSSRRRTFNPEEDVSYINDKNRHFNKKIERAYGEYTKEIKESFERGTAL